MPTDDRATWQVRLAESETTRSIKRTLCACMLILAASWGRAARPERPKRAGLRRVAPPAALLGVVVAVVHYWSILAAILGHVRF